MFRPESPFLMRFVKHGNDQQADEWHVSDDARCKPNQELKRRYPKEGSPMNDSLIHRTGIAVLLLAATTANAARIGDLTETHVGEQALRFFTFSDSSLRLALVGCLLLGLNCGLLGGFIVVRRMSLVGDTLSHAVFPGIALGFLWNMTKDPVAILVGGGVEFPRYGVTEAAPTATVTLDRKTLDDVMLGQAQFPALLQSGAIKIDGDRMAFLSWFALHPPADPRFNVVVP